MLRKLRVSLLLQPLATALFANSPFTEGRPNGFLSYRAHVWTDTDNRALRHSARDVRTGLRFRALRRVAGRSGADVLRLPRRPYIDVAGASFRDFMNGRLHNVAGSGRHRGRLRRPRDDGVHRCADQALPGDARRRCWPRRHDGGAVGALGWPALRRGRAHRGRGAAARRDLGGRGSPAGGGAARGPGGSVARRQLAGPRADVVAIARDGLRGRARCNVAGLDESVYLAPLEAIVAGEPTQAEHWLACYRQSWQGDVRRIFGEAAI